MADVTLVLTHSPYDEYVYDHRTTTITDHVQGKGDAWFTAAFAPNAGIRPPAFPRIYSGLWGTMGVFIGPKVHGTSWPGDEHLGDGVPEEGLSVLRYGFDDGRLKRRVDMAAQIDHEIKRFWLANRILELETERGEMTLSTTYTTAERFRGNLGGVGGNQGFVMLPHKLEPYDLEVRGPYQALIDMRPSHNGDYVRILGGTTPQQQAILIHEAANPGWVTGCIAPRPLGNHGAFEAQDARNPSAVATMELIRTLRTKGGGKGQLFIAN